MLHSYHYAEVDPATGRVKRIGGFRHRAARDRFVRTDPVRFRVISGSQAKAFRAAFKRYEAPRLRRASKAGGAK